LAVIIPIYAYWTRPTIDSEAKRNDAHLYGAFRSVLSASAAEPVTKLSAGYGTITSGYSVMWVAKDAGIFAQNGLDVELLLIQSSPILASAMLSGNVGLAIMGGAAAVTSNLSGSDLVLIGSLRKTSSLSF